MKTFGQTIRELRERKGVSLRFMSRELGRSPSWFSKVERDLEPPSPAVIKRVATLLEADADELMSLAGRVDPEILEFAKAHPKRVRELMAA